MITLTGSHASGLHAPSGGGDGEDGAYSGEDAVAESPEEVAETYRRVLLAIGGVAVVGRTVDKLGELLTLPGPAPVPLPSRIDWVQVAKVRNLT